MTIRAKLYVAILLTVIGPVSRSPWRCTGWGGWATASTRCESLDHRALALDLKFGVTDFNGWQTAYGYDDGASRPRFERSVRHLADFEARNELTEHARSGC